MQIYGPLPRATASGPGLGRVGLGEKSAICILTSPPRGSDASELQGRQKKKLSPSKHRVNSSGISVGNLCFNSLCEGQSFPGSTLRSEAHQLAPFSPDTC